MSLDSQSSNQSGLQVRLTRFGGRTALLVIAVGLVIIGLGYNGIAGAAINGLVTPAAQLPYLISGGVLGLALVIIGAALMVTQSARSDRVQLQGLLEQLVELQRESSVATRSAAPVDVEGLFAAGTASFHRPQCRLVDGREETTYVTAEEARAQHLNPCRVCQPTANSSGVTVR